MKAIITSVSFLFVITVFSLNLNAQTADKVIEKYIKAIGGYDNIKKINTLRFTGNVKVHGFELPLMVTFKRPNKIRIEITFQDISQVQAYDGSVGWKTDLMTGGKIAKKMNKSEEEEIQSGADFEGAIIDYKKKGSTAKLFGKEKTDSVETYKIGIINSSGDTSFYYIDTKDNLIVKRSKIKQESKLMVNTYINSYISSDNLKFPSEMKVIIEESEDIQEIKFDKAEVNIEIDDAIFKMPDNE